MHSDTRKELSMVSGLRFIADMCGMLRAEGFGMKLLMEDLGHLDAGVMNLLKLSGLPGMDIWQFTADYMKEMCEKEPEKAAHRAFYTGTHDNNTLVGWLRGKTDADNNRDHEPQKSRPGNGDAPAEEALPAPERDFL